MRSIVRVRFVAIPDLLNVEGSSGARQSLFKYVYFGVKITHPQVREMTGHLTGIFGLCQGGEGHFSLI